MGPAAAKKAPNQSDAIRSVSSGLIGGASTPGRGSPGAGRIASVSEMTVTSANAQRQSMVASSPDTIGAVVLPAAWKAV